MKSIFDYTIGKQAEDTTSAMLCYILNQHKKDNSYAVLRDFFEIPDDDFTCKDQSTMTDGRFDLLIKSHQNKYCIVVENKLDAEFTQTNNGHQIERYASWLNDQDVKNKKIIILVPQYREQIVQNEIDDLSLEINYEILTWEELCTILNQEHNSFIACELSKYIEKRYNTNVKLTKIESKILVNNDIGKTIAKAFIKIIKLIDEVYQQFEERPIQL